MFLELLKLEVLKKNVGNNWKIWIKGVLCQVSMDGTGVQQFFCNSICLSCEKTVLTNTSVSVFAVCIEFSVFFGLTPVSGWKLKEIPHIIYTLVVIWMSSLGQF